MTTHGVDSGRHEANLSDPAKVIPDVLALVERRAGRSVPGLAAEEGIPVDQMLAEAAALT